MAQNPDYCFVPPLLQPGGVNDDAWCIQQSCKPCNTRTRRYADCDYIDITPGIRKTFIRILRSRHEPMQFDPTHLRIYIEIRRRGTEELVACYDAFQRTADGYVGFYWDAAFTGACEGLYAGDVFVDCRYCFSVLFRIPRCELVVDSCYNEYEPATCGAGECSMLETVGTGVVGGIECEESVDSNECGLPPPYFESYDPAVPIEATEGCNLSCAPPFQISGDGIVGSI